MFERSYTMRSHIDYLTNNMTCPQRTASDRNLSTLLRQIVAGLLLSLPGVDVRAQLSLPVSTPQLPVDAVTRQLDSSLGRVTTQLDAQGGALLRARQIRELLRRHRDVLEADPDGAPVVRGQVIALAPTPEIMLQIERAGFSIVRVQRHESIGLQVVVLAAPPGDSARAALRRLRKIDPNGSYDFNHLYLHSAAAAPAATPIAIPPVSSSPAIASAPARRPRRTLVGLIDAGVDIRHPAFAGAEIQHWGCKGQVLPSAHGTATASLLIGNAAPFRGAVPDAALYAADVYCGEPTGGSLSVIVESLDWLVQAQVAVINISLVGPPNRLLEQVIGHVIARGHIVVAAVGNDGPSAAPLYPAAYPEVTGVTGVDARDRVLVEALRGGQVDFAAPGTDMVAAGANRYVPVRGTSFASPIVAGLLASDLPVPDRLQAARALQHLRDAAIDLGAAGPDRTYGAGLVGQHLRVSPKIIE